jgi:hypothetical protein
MRNRNMQKSKKLGAALLAVGAGAAVATVDSADHGSTVLAVAGGLLSGAATALGTTALIVGWATRRPDREAEEV